MTYFLGMNADWSLIALFAGIICASLLLIFSLISTRRESRKNNLKETITESITPPKKKQRSGKGKKKLSKNNII